MTAPSVSEALLHAAPCAVLEARDLSIGYRQRGGGRLFRRTQDRIVAQRISFQVAPGQALVILGPNGAGKSTLIRALLGLDAPLAGEVVLAGRNIQTMSLRARARWLAYVPQAHELEFAFGVREIVAMGRAPYLSSIAAPSDDDYLRADKALARLGIAHLADRDECDISGGERQLVLIARALVQESRFVLLDEPTANLDLANQARVLAQIEALASSGLGIVMISHAPGHAFACGTHAALMNGMGGFAVGPVAEMISEVNLASVYGTPVHIVSVPTEQGTVRACVPNLRGA